VDTRCASFYFDLPEMQSVYTYEYVYSCTSTVRVLRCTVRCSCTTCTHIHTKVHVGLDILPSKIQNTSGSTCTRTRTVHKLPWYVSISVGYEGAEIDKILPYFS
jgi:hypothetical protein